jgi:hypothetical protein
VKDDRRRSGRRYILRQDPAHDVYECELRKIILPHMKGVERVMQED